jgi:hypothetical protein
MNRPVQALGTPHGRPQLLPRRAGTFLLAPMCIGAVQPIKKRHLVLAQGRRH